MSDGIGCMCAARNENECCCGADWRPKELIDLRKQLASRDAEIAMLRADANEVQAARHVQREHNDLLVKNHKLRKQVKMLRDVLDDKQWAKDGDVHAHNKRVQEALAATKPKP